MTDTEPEILRSDWSPSILKFLLAEKPVKCFGRDMKTVVKDYLDNIQ